MQFDPPDDPKVPFFLCFSLGAISQYHDANCLVGIARSIFIELDGQLVGKVRRVTHLFS